MQLSDNDLIKVDIKQVIKQELLFHPELQLIDLYKLVFQAYMGPGHLINNIDEAANYIITEMLLHSEPYLPIKQDIGNGKGFFRVSLDLLMPEKELKKEQAIVEIYRKSYILADLMKQSVYDNNHNLNITDIWNATVPQIKELIDFDLAEWKEVDLIAESKAIPRHSQIYKTLYNPKYRVLKYNFYDNIDKLVK
ncbi:MAG TPA: hypothetical protein PLI24_01010 [Candidatus Cloacimonas sp.]|jgi:hypothetical protein|nr:hypothetical protein [Candidatus Cloacimonas sp.]MDD2250308.1 hypothetical protein [Candidatus Cloacimonadota bacterium]MCK9157347.1 hypothetical protein [Candidatus Cloacimonas sp.]MCK9165425.1 hypothetical protein [Candidatus Cloacimonas sp.]MDD3733898.1 hypothetical protein [Candidatus Cloacimonadota bacterium]